MVTGRTRPKENALVGAHRALRPKILFEVLHIIIKKLVLFLYDGVWGVPRSSLLYSRFPRCTWRRCLPGLYQLQRASKRDKYLFIVTEFTPLILALLPLSHRDNNTHQSRACHSIHVNHVPHRDTRIISRKARLKYRRAYHRCPAQIISSVSSTDPPYCP